jgi:hypothetical protein
MAGCLEFLAGSTGPEVARDDLSTLWRGECITGYSDLNEFWTKISPRHG